ncbi:MAG: hypothetical protein AAF870_08510, partial [Pseudomonadota bacterium]
WSFHTPYDEAEPSEETQEYVPAAVRYTPGTFSAKGRPVDPLQVSPRLVESEKQVNEFELVDESEHVGFLAAPTAPIGALFRSKYADTRVLPDNPNEDWFDGRLTDGQIEAFPSNLSLTVGPNQSADSQQGDQVTGEQFARAMEDVRRGDIGGQGPLRGHAILTESTSAFDRRAEDLAFSGGVELPEERTWEMKQRGSIKLFLEPQELTGRTELESKLMEAELAEKLLERTLGPGHPDYDTASAKRQALEDELSDAEQLMAANSKKDAAEQSVEELLRQANNQGRRIMSIESEDSVLLAKRRQLAERLLQLSADGSLSEEAQKATNKTLALLRVLDEEIEERIKELKGAKPKPKSWKRVKAIPNTTRLMVGDKEELDLNGMQVNAQVDGFRARVLVDYFYYNDRDRQLEGNFKLRLPDDASLYYFAFGESAYEYSPKGKLAANEFLRDGTQFVSLAADGIKDVRKGQWDNVKEARMVPREKAAHAFRETVRRRVDPALVEWSGAGVFSAKVFPLAPKKLHRIVVGYDVNLKRTADGLNFDLSLPEHTGQCRVELNVQELDGVT